VVPVRGVVVGVSGSAEADEALDWALREAGWRGLPVAAVHVWPGRRGVPQEEHDQDVQQRREQVLELVEAARRRTGHDVEVTVELAEGAATDALLDAATDARMLVLGRRRRGRIGRLVLGSVSSEVVERAEVPVTVVRKDLPRPPAEATAFPDRPGRIVVGVDTSSASTAALCHGLQVAATVGCELEALFAWQITTLAPLPGSWGYAPPLDEYEKFAAARLDEAVDRAQQKAGVTVPGERLLRTVVHAPAARALVEASATAGRVVVGARGLGGFDRLLLGSTSRQVLEYAACPVTVVR
jgi:nucleotide-binding universal stress UspA family protein